MTISSERKGEAVTIYISGRLDTVTAPELEKAVTELPPEVTALTLDMTGLSYISSAGLRVLLGAQKKMNKIGSMELRGVCVAVLGVLEMTGFADFMVIE